MKISFIFLMTFLLLVLMIAEVSAFTEIEDCQGLQDINLNLMEDYVLINDIDCKDFSNFVQIGIFPYTFKGTLDGKDFTISNLQITAEYAGLFYMVEDNPDGTEVFIKNIRFVNPTINMNYEGAVLAYWVGTSEDDIVTIENIYVDGGTVNGGNNEYSGGLISFVNAGVIINNVHFSGYVEGAGGLVGQNDGTITGSSFSGTVNGTTVTLVSAGPSMDLQGLTGGLVGWNFGTIRTSYSEGEVIGLNNIGGLVGGNEFVSTTWPANIYDSYSTSNVTGKEYIGGFTGYNEGGDIKNSYSTGTVTSTLSAAAQEEPTMFGLSLNILFGIIDSLTNDFTPGDPAGFLSYIDTEVVIGGKHIECYNSFWDTETSGITGSACVVQGKTTEEMQNSQTYTTWDINTWLIENGDYPHLAWEPEVFCSQFIISENRKDPNRNACEQADWKDNEGEENTVILVKPENPGEGKGKKGEEQYTNDCYVEKNDKSNPADDVCMATPTAN